MSNTNIKNSPASNDPVVLADVGESDKIIGKKLSDAAALAIDDNDDFGGDPYNHTGSHAVPDFGQDD